MMRRKTKKTISSYTALFTPAEEGGYTVTVPALPGCISEGNSFEDARMNISEAIELYLEVIGHEKTPPMPDFIVAPVKVLV